MISRPAVAALLLIVGGLYLPGAGAGVNLSGFISQSVVYTPDNPFYASGLGTNTDFRELGINGSWQAHAKLRFAGQVISRRWGDIDNGDPRLDFGLLDYQFLSDEPITFGLRLGRIKNAYGLYNTARDVPHARPGTQVPRSTYFEAVRDSILSSDGGNVYFSAANSLGDFALEAYWGRNNLKKSAAELLVFPEYTAGNFGKPIVKGGKLEFIPANVSGLTAAYSFLTTKWKLQGVPEFTPQQIAEALAMAATDPQYLQRLATSTKLDVALHLWSLQYGFGDWILTAEYLLGDTETYDVSVLNIPAPDIEQTIESYYLQGEWMAGEKLSLLARYEDMAYNNDDRRGTEYGQMTGRSPLITYTNGYTLGGRWYFTPDASLTIEYGAYEGTISHFGASIEETRALVEDWELLIVQFSYHF